MVERRKGFWSTWHLEGIFPSISVVFSANVMVAILGFGTLVLTARALGPSDIGILAIIQAYALTFDQFLRFEPSQALIKYGSDAWENDEIPRLRRLIKFSTLIDLCGASMAAMVAYAGVAFFGPWFGFDEEQARLIKFYLATMPFYISATPIAILRLLSRFTMYAKILSVLAVVRILLTAVLWYSKSGLQAFLFLHIFLSISQHLLPFVVAWREIHKRVGGSVMSKPVRGVLKENPSILRFIFNSNINVLARNSTVKFDTFILAGLVSATAIGYYEIAKKIGIAALRVARPVQFVIYPTLSRLWARNERWRLYLVVTRFITMLFAIGFIAVLVMYVWGETIIQYAFGEAFMPAKNLVMLHVIAAAIMLGSTIMNSALLGIGKDKALMTITVLSAMIFFIAIVPLTSNYGVIAGSVLHVTFNTVWSVMAMFIFFRTTGKSDHI